MNKIKVKNAKFSIKNDKIYLQPTGNQIIINFPISGHPKSKFIFELFVIITIISYLGIFLLTNYLADFNTLQHQSRIEIVFLTIFFVLLFIPMSHINQDKVSQAENRRLAKWHPLIKDRCDINFNFGKDYDNWYNDRFNLRKNLVYLFGEIHYILNINSYINNKKGVYINKKTGQMYGSYPSNYKALTPKQLELFSYNLYRLNEYCKKRNIKLVILIEPCVNSYFRDTDILHKTLKEDRTIPLVKYAKDKYNIDILYPEEAIRAEENGEYVYFKTDHHMTDYGSYIVYKIIINKLKKEFPKLVITPKSDFKIYRRNMTRFEYTRSFDPGGEYKSLGINDKNLLKTEYLFYDYKYNNIKVNKLEFTGDYKHYNPKGNYRLMIIGDSTHENLTYLLDTNFKEIYKFRTNAKKNPQRKSELDMEYWNKKIEEIKPDVLIINKHSGTIDGFLTEVWEMDNAI